MRHFEQQNLKNHSFGFGYVVIFVRICLLHIIG
jgi:hypothetical protein